MSETDHQPLESICKKDLASAPKRLQRMLLRLQRYNIDVKYQKGGNMVMSDPLSRAYLDEPYSQTAYCNELEEIVLVDLYLSPIHAFTTSEKPLPVMLTFRS